MNIAGRLTKLEKEKRETEGQFCECSDYFEAMVREIYFGEPNRLKDPGETDVVCNECGRHLPPAVLRFNSHVEVIFGEAQ